MGKFINFVEDGGGKFIKFVEISGIFNVHLKGVERPVSTPLG